MFHYITGQYDRFHKALAQAAKDHRHGLAVTVNPPEFYRDRCRSLWLSDKSRAGFAITNDMEFVSLFKYPSCTTRGIGTIAALHAYAAGARWLQCFAGPLVSIYARAGWEECVRLWFDDTQAPEGWDYQRNGRPDVVFMVHRGRQDAFCEHPDLAPRVKRYEDAKWLVDQAVQTGLIDTDYPDECPMCPDGELHLDGRCGDCGYVYTGH